MPVRLLLPLALLFAQLFAQVAPATAAEARVAVAANFSAPAELLVEHFERAQTHRIELVFGSSARFYSQIRNGAPFDALLSADYEKPYLLAEQGLAAEDSLRAYATGRLVLWSAQSEVPITVDTLRAHGDGKIAMANPRLAPYGLAAREVIENLGLDEQLSENLILGENISQAFQFVATGNAPLGFVALSQVAKDGDIQRGSGWLVPTRLHAPIRQFAVLLNEENAAAAAFLQYLRGPAARRIIAEFGYSVDAGEG